MFTGFNLKRYLLSTLFLISFILLLRVLLLSGYPDFTVFYYGSRHILNHENPYIQDSNYFAALPYPPFTLILFTPFSLLPYEISAKIWVLISVLAVLYIIYLLNKIYNVSFFSPFNLLLSSLIFLSFPLKFTLGMGQVNILILLLVTLAFYFMQKNKFYYSGLFFALPFAIKFFPPLILLYFILQKKWKILLAFTSAIIIIIAITVIIVPLPTMLYYSQKLLPSFFSSWKGDYYNQALTGLLMRNITDPGLRESLRVIIPFILLSINFFAIVKNRTKTKQRENLEIASLVILNVLINNFSWQHHYVFLILPFLIIIFTLRKFRTYKFFYIPLVLSYVLISINFKDPKILPLLLQSHVFFGGLMLWIISIYILYKYKL